MIATRVVGELRPDPARVVAQLFLPGEELALGHSRAGQIVARVLELPEREVEQLSSDLVRDFSRRHVDYRQLLERHASMVAARVEPVQPLSPDRRLVLGACFTAEYAIEGAALCNPSAVVHPDQGGLGVGDLRVAVSLRGIGEGHISSIGFCSAIIGADKTWTFEPRIGPVVKGDNAAATWTRRHLRAVLADSGTLDELAEAVVYALPEEFVGLNLERALAETHPGLLTRAGSTGTADLLRKTVSSAYLASFRPDSQLSQRVLMPSVEEESHGMEDARFTRFVRESGGVEYRATYTAYDGRQVAPRLLVSPDLQTFSAHRLAGAAARNKGMALFPRTIRGTHYALSRSDGESTSLARSVDGYIWDSSSVIQAPLNTWEMLQVGNCGPPIETERGWLVLTHGVGPMRIYSMGAILLDLEDPAQVIGRTRRPVLTPSASEVDGYVPNIVYSCGALLHDGVVWIPYGVDDCRVAVACVSLDELLDDMISDS